jgi:hypothetical protein
MPIFAAKALSFALGHWKGVLIALAFAGLGLKLLAAQGDARHWQKESDRFASLYHAEQSSFALTVAGYRAAAEKARADDLANARRVETQQSAISQEVSHDYQARIADLRARYDALRLRNGSTPANTSGGGTAHLPQASGSASGTDAPAAQEGFPLDDRLTCSLQAEQLDALISWQEGQAAVPR